MSDTNKQTIQSYNAHVREYIDGTPQDVSAAVKSWIEDTFMGLHDDAAILELGSAFGRDADYIEALGYNVQRTDASESFVTLLNSNGMNAKILNALTDDFIGSYDVVFANAVLLHFTREETISVAKKILSTLNENGKFSFSLKRGDGEEWSDHKLGAPRFFRYWQSEEIKSVLLDIGFQDVSITTDEGYKDKWLFVIARK